MMSCESGVQALVLHPGIDGMYLAVAASGTVPINSMCTDLTLGLGFLAALYLLSCRAHAAQAQTQLWVRLWVCACMRV